MRRSFYLLSFLSIMVLVACTGGVSGTDDRADQPVTGEASDSEPIPSPVVSPTTDPKQDQLTALANQLEEIRQILKIPGLAAGVVMDGELIWAEGFGFADLENETPVTADTPFHLASVTKPIAATALMQLIEEGSFSLDDPLSKFGLDVEAQGEVQVWHLLTHTSEGVPGENHNYNGNRYGLLGQVAEAATGTPFSALIAARILEPLGMVHSAPNFETGRCNAEGVYEPPDSHTAQTFSQVKSDMAQPYMLDENYELASGSYSTIFSPAAGLVASVTDLARFDIALDQGRLLQPETQAEMLTPVVSTIPGREDLTYALGWYIQDFEGIRLEWHTGRWSPSVSALYLKVPEADLTFFALANTPNLTTPYPAGSGDIMYSTPALAFYRHLVYPRLNGETLPEVDWTMPSGELANQLMAVTDEGIRSFLERELWSYRMAYYSVGQDREAARLGVARNQAYTDQAELSSYAGRAADRPLEVEFIELDQESLSQFTGWYALAGGLDFLPDVPDQILVNATEEGLVLCAANDDSPLLVKPFEKTRFLAVQGPLGSVIIDFRVVGGVSEKLTARLTEDIALEYFREPN